MASRSYWQASDFLNYSPRLASDILAERSGKVEKKENRLNWDFRTQIYPTVARYCITDSPSLTNSDNL